MRVDERRVFRKRIFTGVIVLFALMLPLFILRSVYAISIFEGLKNGVSSSGWSAAESDSVMQVGQGMTFEASYLFFKIGAVKFRILEKTNYEGKPAYLLQADIQSYSGVPFVDLHAVYNTYADSSTLMCLSTSNSVKDGKNWIFTTTHFDESKKVVDWSQAENGKILRQVVFPFHKRYTDGVSFFYYLRRACRQANGRPMSLNIPIIVDTIRSSVDLTINEKKESCNTDAYKYPLESSRLSGHINFTGFFGITGDFVGWMSADPAQVPLRGDVKVILGSVVVKLTSIDIDGWSPPRANGG